METQGITKKELNRKIRELNGQFNLFKNLYKVNRINTHKYYNKKLPELKNKFKEIYLSNKSLNLMSKKSLLIMFTLNSDYSIMKFDSLLCFVDR